MMIKKLRSVACIFLSLLLVFVGTSIVKAEDIQDNFGDRTYKIQIAGYTIDDNLKKLRDYPLSEVRNFHFEEGAYKFVYDSESNTTDNNVKFKLKEGERMVVTKVVVDGKEKGVGKQVTEIAPNLYFDYDTGNGNNTNNFFTIKLFRKTLITITAPSATYTYNGLPQSLKGIQIGGDGLRDQDEIIVSNNIISRTEVGKDIVYPSQYVKFKLANGKDEEEFMNKYHVVFVNGSLEITPAKVTLTVQDASKIVDEDDPELTATVEGMVNGETLNYTLEREAGDGVGNYTITANVVNNPNYNVKVVEGTFSINPITNEGEDVTPPVTPDTNTPNDPTLPNEPTETLPETPTTPEVPEVPEVNVPTETPNIDVPTVDNNPTDVPVIETPVIDNTPEINVVPTTPALPVVPQPITTPIVNAPVVNAPVVNNQVTPTPITTPVEDNQPATQNDGVQEVVDVQENQTPQAGISRSWALVNLIASLLTVLLAIVMLLIKRKKENDDEDEKNPYTEKRYTWMKLLGIVIGVVSVIVFILTEDITLPMALLDKYSVVMIVIALLQCVTLLTHIFLKGNEEKEETTQA